MAGHSHWANIKHKKAKTDSRRGKIWGKCAKAIMVAAKHGGPDPDSNLSLRYAVDEARFNNMPRDTIERAIKKGAGQLEGADFESIRYEGYGPGGVAIIVDALTDNRTRTAPDMRLIFGKYGGNLGATGCVAYMFDHKGVIVIEESKVSEDRIMELAIDAGAEDVSRDDGLWNITMSPADFISVKGAIEKAKIEISSAELTMLPNMMVKAAGEDVTNAVKLIDALEDNEDVQKVYTNLDASIEDLAKAGA
ncbi:MAG TPA: YebC/PmpR family DNA-binding transcriptional regulator [Phycisphaerales bacterium]|nr:YebC/PmpR family DNA-binding transcriptional regulator [Phycisphaerales bacterium]